MQKLQDIRCLSETGARLSGLHAVFFLALLCIGAIAGDAGANASWKSLKGHATCGGLDANGNLQDACGTTSARFEKNAAGTCPQGSFYDIGTRSCYSCPTGFNRNARPVTSPKACDKPVTASTAAAKFEGAASCPAGTFGDPRNGGECWRCPSGYGRTAAAVNDWNACGVIGKQAVGAEFVGRMCLNKDAFRDPRNGGECWSCPEDHQRTAAAVTQPNACRTTLDFEPATRTAARHCEAGQVFDLVDGGTCWSCPPNSQRTFAGVKTAKACAVKGMNWNVPERGRYSLFGLGKGAENILAKMVAERKTIDNAIKTAAKATGQPEGPLLISAWEVIDNRPWESTYLVALLMHAVIDAAAKPAAQRTESERDLLNTTARLIQWNRQFVAFQAKQANDMWIAARTKAHNEALAKMGAAAIYSGSQVPPPDYNEIVAASIQAGAAVAGPAGAAMAILFFDPLKAAVLPYRAMQAAKMAGEVAKTGVQGAWTAGGATMASAGPIIIAAAVAVIVTMEMDKLMKSEEVEGKIRQAVTNSERPVDIGILLQQKEGPDELLFHWMSVIGGNSPGPSATFRSQVAAYKSGSSAAGTTGITLNPGGNVQVATAQQVQAAIAAQSAAAKPGAPAAGAVTQFDIVSAAGTCLRVQTAAAGAPVGLGPCQPPGHRWISVSGELKPDNARCLSDGAPVTAAACAQLAAGQAAPPALHWEYRSPSGQIVNRAGNCLEARGASAASAPCNAQPAQKWSVQIADAAVPAGPVKPGATPAAAIAPTSPDKPVTTQVAAVATPTAPAKPGAAPVAAAAASAAPDKPVTTQAAAVAKPAAPDKSGATQIATASAPAAVAAPQFDIVSAAGTCLRTQSAAPGAPVGLVPCQPAGHRWISASGELKPDNARCLSEGAQVTAAACAPLAAGQAAPPALHWEYKSATGQIVNRAGNCLEARGGSVASAPCGTAQPAQKWAVRQ